MLSETRGHLLPVRPGLETLGDPLLVAGTTQQKEGEVNLKQRHGRQGQWNDRVPK